MTNQVTIIGAGNLTSSLLTAIHRNTFSYRLNIIDTDIHINIDVDVDTDIDIDIDIDILILTLILFWVLTW